jgi:MoxR-like ATPase
VVDGERLLWLQERVREVPIASYLVDFAARLVLATHPDQAGSPELVRRFVRYGASPRAGQAIILAAKISAVLDGRFNVSAADLRAVAPAALRHRVILNYEAEANDYPADRIVADLIQRVPEESPR